MSVALVLGCGRIGFRHLQAIRSVDTVTRIYVVEKAQAALQAALSDLPATQAELVPFESLEALLQSSAPPIDFAVSAVTTDVQRQVLPALAQLNPALLLLEKPVAQSQADFLAISRGLLGVRVAVNCARNLWTGYRTLHDSGRVAGPIHLDVSANNWGFGCNAIHFIELFRFLTDAREIRARSAQLAANPFPNKRGPAYEEFVGTASFQSEGGSSLQLTCGAVSPWASGASVVIRSVTTNAILCVVDEVGERVIDFPHLAASELGVLPVSRTTAQIVSTGAQSLPDLEQAGVAHAAFFEALELATGRTDFRIT